MLCREAVFQDLLDHEGGCHGQNAIDETLLPGFGLPLDSIVAHEWSFAAYSKVVRSYSYRELTLQSDAVNAVTGLFNRIHLPVDAHFFASPRHDFHNSLLWFQTPSAGTWNTSVRRHGYPSWSWLGWNTHLQYGAYLVPGLELYATSRNSSAHMPSVHSVVYQSSFNDETLLCKDLVMVLEHAVFELDPAPSDQAHGVLRVLTDIARFSIKPYLPSDDEIIMERRRIGNELRGDTYQLCSRNGQHPLERPYYNLETGHLGDFTEAKRLEIGLYDRYPGAYSFAVNESSFDPRTESLEFILLQHWIRNDAAQLPELLHLEGPPPQETLDHVAAFQDRVYVMAIRRHPDGVAERVAVLWLDADTWLAANPQPTTLRLG
ncbi:hypothetical protein H2200_013079 [Cladophialophora chaetospira]|uniref:Uncharacterized protein n=1 Tax=Cladophialophora chaetospira TaxID=386627 RepID=A0AA38WWQ2_9EURO|nr:hypothetical protein H2200_013079 [Cladophialophora chaetospira]